MMDATGAAAKSGGVSREGQVGGVAMSRTVSDLAICCRSTGREVPKPSVGMMCGYRLVVLRCMCPSVCCTSGSDAPAGWRDWPPRAAGRGSDRVRQPGLRGGPVRDRRTDDIVPPMRLFAQRAGADPPGGMHPPTPATDHADLFRLTLLVLLVGEMFVHYDARPNVFPHINLYLLVNLALIVLAVVPWRHAPTLLWALAWPLGALMRGDWATRFTRSDVYWATTQAVTFLLHGQNPYTHVPTLVYKYQPEAVNYPTYSYFPGALFAEIPFYLLGNVRLGLVLAEMGTALLLYLFARPRIGVWPARCVAAFWLLFLHGFQIPLRLGIIDSLLLFWIVLAVYLYSRGKIVGSALAAGMVVATKQYGVIFALPWAILLLQPLVASLQTCRYAGARGRAIVASIPREMWLPPVAGALLTAAVILPLASLSPNAFLDATILNHSRETPRPMLGTPQWNESIAAQVVALGWLSLGAATAIARVVSVITLLWATVMVILKARDLTAALRWSAVLGVVAFAFSGAEVQFFYWRLPVFLFALYTIARWSGGTADQKRAADAVAERQPVMPP